MIAFYLANLFGKLLFILISKNAARDKTNYEHFH